jgi:hypothetical protein
MPSNARRKGSSVERDDTAFSALPLKPTRVPRLVYRACDGANEAESNEKGAPRTSKFASGLSGLEVGTFVGSTSSGGVMPEGVEEIETHRRCGRRATRRTAWLHSAYRSACLDAGPSWLRMSGGVGSSWYRYHGLSLIFKRIANYVKL